MQNKQILFLTRLYHPHIGGVEKHVEELSRILKRQGFDITIVTERYEKNLPLIEYIDGIRVYRIPVPKGERIKKFAIWKWIIINAKIFADADIIHIHDVFYWYLPLRFIFLNKKVYITFHGYEGFPIRFRWILQRKIAELMTNGNICVGNFIKKWYKTNTRLVIYGGVRLESKRYHEKAHTGVFFGRLDDQTGILEYVKAYKLIKKEFPDFSMTVVGEGELKTKIPHSIKLIGFKRNIYPYIKKNSIIFVSRYLSILEALALKKEVIATYDNPIKKDYLLMSPFKKYIHIASDANDIANEVIKIFKSKISCTKVEEGAKWARSQTWEKVANTYLRLWNIR